MKAMIGKNIFTIIELFVSSVIMVGLVALSIPSVTDQLEKSRDEDTIENIQLVKEEAQLVFKNKVSNDKDIKFITYPETVGNDGQTKAMVVVKDFIAKGKQKNNFSELSDSLALKNVCHETIASLDDGDGKKYVIEFKYNQANELYLVQTFEQDNYNMAIFQH